MNKKSIIIGISIILVVAVVVLSILYVVTRPKEEDTPTDTSTSQTLPIAETPDYKSCEVTNTDIIQATFNPILKMVTAGERSGLIAPNGEKADRCTYKLEGQNGDAYSLAVTVYPYSVSVEGEAVKDPIDENWPLMSEAKTPTYSRISETATQSVFTTRVVTAGKNILFTFTQQKDGSLVSNPEVYTYALALSNATDFSKNATVDTPSDLPPQPEYN